MSSSTEEQSSNRWGTTKCRKFLGKYIEYTEWKTKFLALAEIKGFLKYYKTDVLTVTREEIEDGVHAGTTNNVTIKTKAGGEPSWKF